MTSLRLFRTLALLFTALSFAQSEELAPDLLEGIEPRYVVRLPVAGEAYFLRLSNADYALLSSEDDYSSLRGIEFTYEDQLSVDLRVRFLHDGDMNPHVGWAGVSPYAHGRVIYTVGWAVDREGEKLRLWVEREQ